MKADLRWKLDDWHAHSGSKLDLEELRRTFEDMVEAVDYTEDDHVDYENKISSLEDERDSLQDELDDANDVIDRLNETICDLADEIFNLKEELQNIAERDAGESL